MPAIEPRRSSEEIERLGADVFDRKVKPVLRPEDDGKFVAIDVDTGAYEVDGDDYSALMRLRTRMPTAEIWLIRAGRRATYKLRLHR